MNENNGNNETQKTAGTEKIRKRDLVKQYQDELNKLNAEIERIEPKAFVVMNSVKDTRGGMIKKRPLQH